MSSDSARMEVVQCERDIQTIKAALRQVSNDEENNPNSLEVVLTEMEGMDWDDSMEVMLQLSSPVEELSLKKTAKDGEEGSSATFSGVESSMATLTVTLKQNGKVVGTSESIDLSPICSMGDAMNPKESYVTTLPVAIVAPAGAEETTAEAVAVEEKPTEEETAAATEEAKPSEESDDKKEESTEAPEDKKETTKEDKPTVILPLCTLSLNMVFKPSAKDLKEALYELLNKASLRRSQALDRHRDEQKSAMTAAAPPKKPAVKAGFLNKKPKKDEESKLVQFYNKWLGPKSLGRGVIFPIAKNYVIFFGAIVLMHFKGQELSLPAPV